MCSPSERATAWSWPRWRLCWMRTLTSSRTTLSGNQSQFTIMTKVTNQTSVLWLKWPISRKASRHMIDSWLVAHSLPPGHCLPISPKSGSSTPHTRWVQPQILQLYKSNYWRHDTQSLIQSSKATQNSTRTVKKCLSTSSVTVTQYESRLQWASKTQLMFNAF